ncbi:FAD/NAD(P)-binding protein [Sphingobium sp. AP49]|uniref:FAD/NAD(P)-binding protein n=1 Tax=Sphingobium sp. AP49 TaxID=1144307 RepID=UPI00026EE580|nr:FAD/NAD(P)-binding protein [Sphingobium sp. AP49]WHO39436.1 FAD/NAD(P)-binding protein [Sphingobium sp. AP49]
MATAIAFVGAGPTTIYTLNQLIDSLGNFTGRPDANISIFEAQSQPGLGTPYRPGWNDPAMLSNIASVEIPPLAETLIDWLGRQDDDRLRALGIDPSGVDERTFYPRLALGRFFLDQFTQLVERARAKGIDVNVRARTKVVDIEAVGDGLKLTVASARLPRSEEWFDYVVLATGHQWPEEPEVRPGYYLSPWPASALQRIAATKVGLRGSSLTAIDAVVALAVAHGQFEGHEGEALTYRSKADGDALQLTMMSRKGLLPEADFYHPIPYTPLAICTQAAVIHLIEDGEGDILHRAYALFRQELEEADPDYATGIALADLTLEQFSDRYFGERADVDPFEWAQANLAEARRNFAKEITVPWRYAILRMHEVMALIVPHLEEDELERFDRFLKPIFVDDYATVPHLSIERLIALHRAGILDVKALGENYRIDSHGADRGAHVLIDGEDHHYPVFIEATGQRPLDVDAFPFPTMIEQDIVQNAADTQGCSVKGIAIDEGYHPVSDDPVTHRLYCLSLPFILGRHPFVQGITSSHEMGLVVGAELAAAIATRASRTAVRPDQQAGASI